MNFISELEQALTYIHPLSYEQMIQRWEEQCKRVGCNYMAVEYPEFSLPGGYQKAINAKPLFIRKALESCGGLAVLYIDGDMAVNQYPHIFDMPDIDFMARGWNIDPRSSYRYRPPTPDDGDDWIPGIEVDPYVFETSGGIMYFSDSVEAHGLLNLWVSESAKPANQGKADDRIISLIFNTKHLLAPMKILQLPIEYLWLTMDYDYSVAEDDWNPAKIYVSHPECLTSEDTAGAQGASSMRQPKFYEALEDKEQRSEWLYESVMFPSAFMASQFAPWLNYIGEATYYAGDLKGESPFYVVPWGSYGRKDPILKANQQAVATAPNISTQVNRNVKLVTMNEESFTIVNILRQFTLGHDMLYIPRTATPGYTTAIRNILDVEHNDRLELIFADTHGRVKPSEFFLFTINLEQPIYIRHGNPLLYVLIALCSSIEELSTTFHANYQFLSRIRIHVLKSVKKPFQGGKRTNSNSNNNSNKNKNKKSESPDHHTEDAYEALYKRPERLRRISNNTRILNISEVPYLSNSSTNSPLPAPPAPPPSPASSPIPNNSTLNKTRKTTNKRKRKHRKTRKN